MKFSYKFLFAIALNYFLSEVNARQGFVSDLNVECEYNLSRRSFSQHGYSMDFSGNQQAKVKDISEASSSSAAAGKSSEIELEDMAYSTAIDDESYNTLGLKTSLLSNPRLKVINHDLNVLHDVEFFFGNHAEYLSTAFKPGRSQRTKAEERLLQENILAENTNIMKSDIMQMMDAIVNKTYLILPKLRDPKAKQFKEQYESAIFNLNQVMTNDAGEIKLPIRASKDIVWRYALDAVKAHFGLMQWYRNAVDEERMLIGPGNIILHR